MLRIASIEEMKQSFRPIDQDEVEFPSDLVFPLLIRDYLAWVEPSGHRTFLVFADPVAKKPRGIVFKRGPSFADAPAAMCDWCHSVRGKGSVGLLTAAVSKTNRVGLMLCRDLSCRDKLEKPPAANDVFETHQPDDKKRRLLERMSHFAQRNLF